MFAKIKCLKIQEPAVRGSVEVIKHMYLFTFWINSKATKHQSCPLLCMCVSAGVFVCVCVEIKARPVLTPCASLGKIKPSWGQGQWRGGNKCEQKWGKKGERECSEALKSRGRPADIFYVHVEGKEKKKKGFVVVFCSFSDEVYYYLLLLLRSSIKVIEGQCEESYLEKCSWRVIQNSFWRGNDWKRNKKNGQNDQLWIKVYNTTYTWTQES